MQFHLAQGTSAGQSQVVIFATEDHYLLQSGQGPSSSYHDEEDVEATASEDHP